MSSLRPTSERGGAGVLNGIALGDDHVLLTGKNWDRMYKVVFNDWPTLFGDQDAAAGDDAGRQQRTEERADDGSSVVQRRRTSHEEQRWRGPAE